jgi:hypothetical protein
VTAGSNGATRTIDRSRNADGTLDRTVTGTPPTR